MSPDHSGPLATVAGDLGVAKERHDRLYAQAGEIARQLQEVRDRRQEARHNLSVIIDCALKDGMTWKQIGRAMGITAQGASQLRRRL